MGDGGEKADGEKEGKKGRKRGGKGKKGRKGYLKLTFVQI